MGLRCLHREGERVRERLKKSTQSERERESETGGDTEKGKKKMERTPRPEMGRERGRRWTLTGVSTTPAFTAFTTKGKKVTKRKCIRCKAQYNSM